MQDQQRQVELLGLCLAFRLESAELAALRTELFSDRAIWEKLTALAISEGLAKALEGSLRARGLLISDFLPAESGRAGPDDKLRVAAAALSERREVLGRYLRDVIRRLNGIGIEPIVIKGAQSLLTGEPDWRHLRDFDLFVPDRADDAQEELLAMGFQVGETDQRTRRHHLPPLVREDFPGFIEIHRRSGNQYLRTLLPSDEIAAASLSHSESGLRFKLLPEHLYALYGLLHHHVGHSADARGNVSIKGLYEFAWDLNCMSELTRRATRTRADRHPRMSVALDSWIAAAADLYRMPVQRPFEIRTDAAARWRRTLNRLEQLPPWYKYPGYLDEIPMGLDFRRILETPLGNSMPGRLWMRLRVVSSFLPKFSK